MSPVMAPGTDRSLGTTLKCPTVSRIRNQHLSDTRIISRRSSNASPPKLATQPPPSVSGGASAWKSHVHLPSKSAATPSTLPMASACRPHAHGAESLQTPRSSAKAGASSMLSGTRRILITSGRQVRSVLLIWVSRAVDR